MTRNSVTEISDPKTNIRFLKGVGPTVAKRLEKLGIRTIQDVLFHLPFRYEDRTHLTPMRRCRTGEFVVVEGVVQFSEIRKAKRTSLLCHLTDNTGQLVLRFFHYNFAQRRLLETIGLRLRCFGEVRFGTLGFEIIHPEYQIIDPKQPLPMETRLTPVYPTTAGISQTLLRKLVKQALQALENPEFLPDYLPEELMSSLQFPSLIQALHACHQPSKDVVVKQFMMGVHPAQKRLALEELLAFQLYLCQMRQKTQKYHAWVLAEKSTIRTQLIEQLPFKLTAAQRRVIAEISQDLNRPYPMLRLIQGDVGSGKTIVAALAVLQAVSNGYQAAVMVPTEILAEQHYRNFIQWLTPLGIQISELNSNLTTVARKNVLSAIVKGETQVVIGTHALFQNDVTFAKLALVIIDEQHRFGVHQRLTLCEKGKTENFYPHQLIMTATPIPRTLAMTVYADLDCSVIDELPPGRKTVTTAVISQQRRDEVIKRVSLNCQQGHQVYWVCTLIEESELLQCQAAEKTQALLQTSLPHLNIGLVHGRMKTIDKEEVMNHFKAGKLNVLVATTVIEVGVDIPNANLMVIENPERLGLAQLHQLRGRVGRGEQQCYCILLYQSPLSQIARKRLNIMRQFQDGFHIAEQDLNLRGPGEFLGTKQTGLLNFKIANILKDAELMHYAQKLCSNILKNFPNRASELVTRWINLENDYSRV